MKKGSVIVELVKLFGMMVVGWILWVFVFAITTTPEESELVVEPFQGASLIFGVLTGLIICFGLKYNAMHKAQQATKAAFSNISVFEERAEKLFDKANRVADKYMDFEGSVQVQIAHERGTAMKGKRISNAKQFQTALEGYPDLKANQSIMELLNQIKDCENKLANQKFVYNQSVEEYNTLIHSFPASLLRKIGHFEDAEFYTHAEENMVSDEALGI